MSEMNLLFLDEMELQHQVKPILIAFLGISSMWQSINDFLGPSDLNMKLCFLAPEKLG